MIANKSIVEKFGRIPTRNKVLGRLSTEEEQFYLLGLRGVPVDLTFFNYLGGKMAKDETDLSIFFYLGGKMSSQGYGVKRDEVSHDAISKLWRIYDKDTRYFRVVIISVLPNMFRIYLTLFTSYEDMGTTKEIFKRMN